MHRQPARMALILVALAVSLPLAAIDISQVERHVHLLVNRERAAQNLPAVALHAALSRVARNHSQAMATRNFFSHTDHQGRSPFDRMRQEAPEVKWSSAAENIAMNHGNDAETLARNLMTAWMNSSGHRANILNRSYTHIGVGVSAGGSGYYATQVFAGGVTESGTPQPPEAVRDVPAEPGVIVDKKPATPATVPTGADEQKRRYTCVGSNPDGTRYEGYVEITRRGMTWHFLWKVGRQTYRGQGTMRGGNLVVDWGQADPVIYRIQADGRLKGIWAGGKGTETLTPE